MERFDSIEAFAESTRESFPEMSSWGPNTIYSTMARVNPGIVDYVAGSPTPAYRTPDELLSSLRSVNPRYAKADDQAIVADLAAREPVLASAWFLPEDPEGGADPEDGIDARDDFDKMFDVWYGRRPEKPLEEYELGRELLELGKRNEVHLTQPRPFADVEIRRESAGQAA